jgi:hypothetical protein
MNRFHLHHRDSIRFGYGCFDRLILRGAVLPFQSPKRSGTIYWFLRTFRGARQISRSYLAGIASEYHDWVSRFAQQQGLTILEPDRDAANRNRRRAELVEPYFQQLGARDGVAVILKAREPERIVCHYARNGKISIEWRHVYQYYFYLHDPCCGRMFLRICPYFPCNITVWLNGHNWLARQLQHEGIAFEKLNNLFVNCAQPERLQELSDAFAPEDIIGPVDNWLARLLPYYTEADRQRGYRHQLYLTQVEYCHNLIFDKQAALERLFDRLMDANRGIGHPDKLAVVFARGRYRLHTHESETALRVTRLRLPVFSSSYRKTSIKQYASGGVGLRTESTTSQVQDLSLHKNIRNLPQVRQALRRANDRFQDVQQDILATYVDRGQLEQLRQPSVSPTGRRVPGLHVDDPRLLAVLQALLCFAYLVGRGCFRTKDLLADVRHALSDQGYSLSQLRYDLGKLRAKGLVWRCPGTQEYQLSQEGYRIGVYYLKLYRQLYAPIVAAIQEPVPRDNHVLNRRQTKLDRLYVAVDKALQDLAKHLGMPSAA